MTPGASQENGWCEGGEPLRERHPEAVRLAKRLYRANPVTEKRRSLRKISAELAAVGHLMSRKYRGIETRGRSILQRSRPWSRGRCRRRATANSRTRQASPANRECFFFPGSIPHRRERKDASPIALASLWRFLVSRYSAAVPRSARASIKADGWVPGVSSHRVCLSLKFCNPGSWPPSGPAVPSDLLASGDRARLRRDHQVVWASRCT